MRRCVADAKVLLVGYGNPLRGDDGLGPAAAEELARVAALPGVEVLTPHQLTPELVDSIVGVDLVLFVDARAGTDAAGTIHEMDLLPGEGAAVGPLAHHQSPLGLLSAAQALFGHCPPAVAFSVTGGSFDFGVGLSPSVRRALPLLVERMAVRVRSVLT